MQYFNGAMGEALWNGVLHLFVTFWFLWCLIPTWCWHSHTHRERTRKSAWGVGTLERCSNMRAPGWGGVVGRLVSVGREGTRWHLLAEAKQELHKPIQSEQFQPANTPKTHPSSSELSFLLPLWPPPSRKGAAAAAARCPGSRMPSNHSGTSLALPRQPPARPNPGFSCLGLRTVRFFSSKMFSKESVDYSYSALKMHFKK